MKKLAFLLTIVLFAGCSTKEILPSYNIAPLNSTKDYINYKNAIIYSLPRNIIKVTVSVTKTTKEKGPYSDFAEKYLGIKDIIQETSSFYAFEHFNIETIAIPDTNESFVIENDRFNTQINLLQFTEDGIIRSVNSNNNNQNFNTNYKNFFNNNNPNKNSVFTDLTIKPFFEEKTKRVYNNVKKDSGYVKVAVTKKITIHKDTEQKAKEAANFILKLRKRRFKLISGTYEKFPEGKSIIPMIAELNKLEQNYINIFTGISITDTLHYIYYFNPQE